MTTAPVGRSAQRGADLIVTGGRVWTGLGDDVDVPRSVSTIAVAGDMILEVGTDEVVARWRTPYTRIIDVGGRRIVPGLIDSHLHAIRAGLSYADELDWTGVRTLAEALATVHDAVQSSDPGEWVTVMGGWHPSQFADAPRMPEPAELSQIAPTNPVFVHPLYGYDDHAVLNRCALEALGWVGECSDPAGGVLGRLPDGTPDGTLRGVAAYQIVGQAASRPSHSRMVESSRAFFERLAAVGLTGVIDAGGLGMSPDKYHAVRALWRDGRLPLRVRTNLCPVTRGNEPAEVLAWQDVLDPGVGDELLSVLGVGEVLHYGTHDWEGMEPLVIADDAFDEFVHTLEETARRRWPATIHCVLDTSIGRILDAIEIVADRVGIDGLRWNLCHAECISRANLERVRRLGLSLALQGRLTHKASVVAGRWGVAVMRHTPPLADIIELGIPFGAGTDGTRAASYNPWLSLWWFVTGRSLDGGPVRDAVHLIDRARALDAYTRGSAWFSFEEDRRGALRPGMLADLAVLNADYFTVPEDAIPEIESDVTIVAGRVVHRSAAFHELDLDQHDPRPGPRPALEDAPQN